MEARRPKPDERGASDTSGVPPLAGVGSVLTRNWWVVALRGVFNDGVFAIGSALSRVAPGGGAAGRSSSSVWWASAPPS